MFQNKNRATLILLILTISLSTRATTYYIGPTHTYTSPNALYQAAVVTSGDTILIESGTYSGSAALAVWSADDLLIQGVGTMPVLDAQGQYIQGKGIWVLSGDNITVENIEFTGATVPDQNGAGIRLDGSGLTVRSCYFHDNENGILATSIVAGEILVEYSEFGYNGFGDGQSHNIYINNTNKFTFQFNFSHHAYIGHCVKTRAAENHILYNRIMDLEDGQSSRLIDVSNGGKTLIMGNTMMQGPLAENNNLIGYGLEGLSHSSAELYIVNNTLVNERQASCVYLHIQDGSTTTVANTLFVGGGTLVNGQINLSASSSLVGQATSSFFVDPENYDYQLAVGSLAIDAGATIADENGLALTPSFMYAYDADGVIRTVSGTSIDQGAFEFQTLTNATNLQVELTLFPNPVSSHLLVGAASGTNYRILDQRGAVVKEAILEAGTVDVSTLPSGTYYLMDQSGKTSSFVKL